ncbi:MAG: cbb3-type cytochrome oxidase assembly protein CcoS [Marinobacter sp.]|nr:cbb3-type cytochrome oxidase assembly protein CcoS [Marinobacter sp.]
MESVLYLVPLMLILVAVGIGLFSWAVKSGQYDDLEGPAHRILYDDDKEMIPKDAQTPDMKQDPEESANSGEDSDGKKSNS